VRQKVDVLSGDCDDPMILAATVVPEDGAKRLRMFV